MRQAGETLPFNSTLTKVTHSYKKVPWTFSADGCLRSGDSVMLESKKVNGFLSVDLGVNQPGVDGAFRLTGSTTVNGPVTRSVFVLKRFEAMDIFGADNIIRFGQKIRIESNPHLYKKTLAVGSMPMGPAAHSPISRHQEASMHAHSSFNNVWIIDSQNPNDRFERQGEPVRAGDPILFRHSQTQHYLACDLKTYKNDFGTEFEVCAHSFASPNKTQNLALERNG